MSKVRPRKGKLLDSTRDTSTQTPEDEVLAENARLKNDLKLLQVELNALRVQLPAVLNHAQQQSAKSPQQRLNKGCNCKGNCSNRICGCVKKDANCGPGCNCKVAVCQNQMQKTVDKENREVDRGYASAKETQVKTTNIEPFSNRPDVLKEIGNIRLADIRAQEPQKHRSLFSPEGAAEYSIGDKDYENMTIRFDNPKQFLTYDSEDSELELEKVTRRKMKNAKKKTAFESGAKTKKGSHKVTEKLGEPENGRKCRSMSNEEELKKSEAMVAVSRSRRSYSTSAEEKSSKVTVEAKKPQAKAGRNNMHKQIAPPKRRKQGAAKPRAADASSSAVTVSNVEVVEENQTNNSAISSNSENRESNPMKPTRELPRTPVRSSSHNDNTLTDIPTAVFRREDMPLLPPLPREDTPTPPEGIYTPEVDWESHKANLVRCELCNRTFYPGRIKKHQACCKKV